MKKSEVKEYFEKWLVKLFGKDFYFDNRNRKGILDRLRKEAFIAGWNARGKLK